MSTNQAALIRKYAKEVKAKIDALEAAFPYGPDSDSTYTQWVRLNDILDDYEVELKKLEGDL